MLKVLVVARYHDNAQSQKFVLLSQQSDVCARLIYPQEWESELEGKRRTNLRLGNALPILMLGKPNDPHRAVYKTLSFSISQFKPDIIHAEEEPDSIPALQIAIARRLFAPRAKLLFTTWQNINRPLKSYVRLAMKITLAASDGICCANLEAMAILRQNAYTKPTYPLLPTGVDTSVFKPSVRGKTETTFIVGYVGRLVQEKSVHLIIEAVNELRINSSNRPVKLLIMGEGPERTRLQQMVSSMNLEGFVEFFSAGPFLQVASFMQRLDVLVLPSRTTSVWKEQFGRVLVEAMACKVAVIGASTGAIPEVIGNAGMLFDECNSQHLASQLQHLMSSPTLQADLAEHGYTRVMEHYTQERIVQQTIDLYRSLIA